MSAAMSAAVASAPMTDTPADPAPAIQPPTPTPTPTPAHTRVFVSDGAFFCLPLDAYEAVRDAIRRNDDYEGVDLYGDPVFLPADYLRACARRSAAANVLRAAATWG